MIVAAVTAVAVHQRFRSILLPSCCRKSSDFLNRFCNRYRFPAAARMSDEAVEQQLRRSDPGSNPKVAKLREVVSKDASGGWEKCWEEGVTPWDLGQPTPAVEHLVKTGSLPKGRILVPGCGTGYDVVAMAGPERYVVGLEISKSAIKKAKEWSASFPNATFFTFLLEDFFTWQPNELFDVIFDYTFFCAIDPLLRPAWAKKASELLRPDGELITLIYLINDQDGGPPYNNSLADYQNVLHPLGFKALIVEDNALAIKPRRGKEMLGRWMRLPYRSPL